MTVQLLAILGEGLADPDKPVLRADDLGLTRGDGCFEGCRVVTTTAGDSRVDKLDAHLHRMRSSADALEIGFDEAAWRDLVGTACGAWRRPGEAGMRLVLTRGRHGVPDRPTGLLTISPLPEHYPRQRREGLRIRTVSRGMPADAHIEAPWLLGGVKTLSYAINMAAIRHAERHGLDDVIFVSTDGVVLEAPTSSVVWATGRVLHTTPPGPSGILGGTTQQLLFDRAAAAGWRTEFVRACVEDLHRAEVLWLVATVRGPVDVVELDGTPRLRVPGVDAEIRLLAGFAAP